ncbi:MAG: response regulator [Thermodesulfobacteriota bacterium]
MVRKPAAAPPPTKGTVLAVDDEPLVLRLLANQATKLGYVITTADNGPAALALIRRHPFDILLTDILMPEMDGITLLRQALKLRPDLQCIVASGQHEVKTAVEAMKQGAINYLPKPVSIQELDVAFEKAMERLGLIRQLREKQGLLETAARELSRHRDHLEQLVAERTAELAVTNRQLKKDIRARIRAEKEAERRRQQLIEADKMASLGVLVAGVAHEINNPNNFITMNTPILRQAWEDFAPILEAHLADHGDFTVAGIPYTEMRHHVPELFAGIADGSERIRKIVLNLRDYARQGTAAMDQLFDLNQVVRAALTLLANPLKKATSHLTVEYGEALPLIRGNFQRAEQVVINLIQNAYQSLADPEQRLTIAISTDKKRKEVVLRVRDSGCGIAKKNLRHIQDPFFTTRRDTGGTGLGLSISAGIMEEHGGRLRFTSQPGKGTTASAIFPAVAS